MTELQVLIEQRKERAIRCAESHVARHQMCNGCDGQIYCGIFELFDRAHPDNALKAITEDPQIMANVTVVQLGTVGQYSIKGRRLA